MKATYNVSKVLTIELDAATEQDLFEQVASLQEAFSDEHCPIEGSKQNLKFVVRDVGGDKFYEMHCPDTNARLAFGLSKKGGKLYPKRTMDKSAGQAPFWRPWSSKTGKDDNKWYDNKFNGWHLYNKDKSKEPEKK